MIKQNNTYLCDMKNIIKLIIIAVVIAIAFFLTSCKKVDEDNTKCGTIISARFTNEHWVVGELTMIDLTIKNNISKKDITIREWTEFQNNTSKIVGKQRCLDYTW